MQQSNLMHTQSLFQNNERINSAEENVLDEFDNDDYDDEDEGAYFGQDC